MNESSSPVIEFSGRVVDPNTPHDSRNSDQVESNRGVWLMLLSVILFSSNSLFIKLAGKLPGISTWEVTFFRSWVGLLILFICFFPKHFRPLRLVTNRWLFLRGIIGASGCLVFYLTLIKMDIGRATVLNLTYPVFATLIAGIFLKEIILLRQMGYMFLAVCGVALIMDIQNVGFYFQPIDLIALLGAVLAGVVVVLIRKLSATEHASTIFGGQCFYGLLITTPIVFYQFVSIPWEGFALLFIAGVIVGFGQITMTQAYKHLPVSRGASIQLLLPVFNSIGGILFFQERYTVIELIGGLLVIYACFRIVVGKVAKQPKVAVDSDKVETG